MERAGRRLAYRSSAWRSVTLTERNPSPTGVVMGPLRATRRPADGLEDVLRQRRAVLLELRLAGIDALPVDVHPGRRHNGHRGIGQLGPDAIFRNERDGVAHGPKSSREAGSGVVRGGGYNRAPAHGPRETTRALKLQEYHAKTLLREQGLPVPDYTVVDGPAAAREAAEAYLSAGAGKVVIKAQVLVGGRGKAGGVKLAGSPDEAAAVAGADPGHGHQGQHRPARAHRAGGRHRA